MSSENNGNDRTSSLAGDSLTGLIFVKAFASNSSGVFEGSIRGCIPYLVSDASKSQHDVVVVKASPLALRAQVVVVAHRTFVADAGDRIIEAPRRALVALDPVNVVPVARFCRSGWRLEPLDVRSSCGRRGSTRGCSATVLLDDGRRRQVELHRAVRKRLRLSHRLGGLDAD